LQAFQESLSFQTNSENSLHALENMGKSQFAIIQEGVWRVMT